MGRSSLTSFRYRLRDVLVVGRGSTVTVVSRRRPPFRSLRLCLSLSLRQVSVLWLLLFSRFCLMFSLSSLSSFFSVSVCPSVSLSGSGGADPHSETRPFGTLKRKTSSLPTVTQGQRGLSVDSTFTFLASHPDDPGSRGPETMRQRDPTDASLY